MATSVLPASSGTLTSSGDASAVSATKVIVNGDVLFTATGAVEIINLYSECVTLNDATASTLQYSITPTSGSATTISAASASLANAAAGTIVVLSGATLATAPVVTAGGIGLGTAATGVIFKAGAMTAVVGTGSTTGTWRHIIRYRPLEANAIVY
jgi:hypothetical protein